MESRRGGALADRPGFRPRGTLRGPTCAFPRPSSQAPDGYNADMNSSNSSFPLDAAWRIDRDRLMSLAARPVRDWPIEIVDETGSTNADLMAQLKEQPRNKTSASAPDSFSPRSTLKAADGTPFVRVAYSQTSGRGRRGRAGA